MKELSIFIDESGDFGEARDESEYYLVSFVFHEQANDISKEVLNLENSVKESGWDIEYIHTGPVIRREGIFENHTIDDRRKLLYKMLNFLTKAPLKHHTIVIKRKESRLSRGEQQFFYKPNELKKVFLKTIDKKKL